MLREPVMLGQRYPNITGTLEFPAKEYIGVNACAGAFSADTSVNAGYTYSAWDQGVFRRVTISAAKSCNVFGGSALIQPSAFQIFMIIKT